MAKTKTKAAQVVEVLTVEILTKARALIRKGWCQDAYAKTKSGEPCGELEPEASRFCARGAVYRSIPVGRSDYRILAAEVFGELDEALPNGKGGSLVRFNDTRGRKRSEVVSVFTRAIQKINKRRRAARRAA